MIKYKMIASSLLCYVFISIFILNCFNVNAKTDDGLSDDFRAHFASKTSYSIINQTISNHLPLKELKFDDLGHGVCVGEVIQLWIITRHGTRYPMKDELERMRIVLPIIAEELVFNYKEGRGVLGDKDVKLLENFVPPYSVRDAGELQEAGADELFRLGQFWLSAFPQIFSSPYSVHEYKVEFSKTNRTSQSAYHFLRGVFGDDAIGSIELPSARDPDFKLRAYHSCPAWKREVRKSSLSYREQKLFIQSEVFRKMLKSVTERLGYVDAVSLEDLLVLYDECRYEVAWWPDKAALWCKFFSSEDIQVLEYYQNLKYYYKDSYGGPEMNNILACETAADLHSKFSAGVEGKNGPRAALYFSHDKTLLHLFTLLGLYKPETHLKHDSFANHRNSVFSLSRMVPFAANVAFVLRSCTDGTYKISAMHNGRPLSLANLCPDESDGLETMVSCTYPIASLQKISERCKIQHDCYQHDEL